MCKYTHTESPEPPANKLIKSWHSSIPRSRGAMTNTRVQASTPHHTSTYLTTPHHTSLYHTTPYHTSLHLTIPYHTSPHLTTTHFTTYQHITHTHTHTL